MGNFWKKPASSQPFAQEVVNADSVYPYVQGIEPGLHGNYLNARYRVERILAILLLVPVIPIIFLIGCIVRMTSRGPAIYRQTRTGLLGQDFHMYKIRTMVADAEGASGATWCAESDPRITTIGRFLRFLHLDELPQLLNIAMGQMSFIGPRPERPAFVRVLRERIAGYDERLMVKPGITGLAQIFLPADQTLKCVQKKIKMDRAYIQTASFSVDLKIILCTMLRMIGLRHGKGPKVTGLSLKYADAIKECHRLDENNFDPISIADIRLDPAEEAADECYMEPRPMSPVFIGMNNDETFEKSIGDTPNKPR